ncbi:MAG: UDP-N-acetylmuramate:L-alanyl-gamma-D-glutamyl-meso-diaminopimelate ligase [Gammaproteobacteria bacterium]|nr:UDP-N-acetylmuramate:L-alanyl-gamma-D-glutamyl-meso-diaminopimelate ligase [Gammaproteobacteria bacterium]
MRIHILGICGTLMGSIACLAKELNHEISGTDEDFYPPMSEQLEAIGVQLEKGYTANSIPRNTDLVIIGNSNISRTNPALEFVLDNAIPFMSGAEWLYRFVLHDRWVIAVAGTHGKTTTTSMITWILEQAKLSPGFLIGGVPKNFPESSRLGEGPFFVIEADEYDTSFFDRRSKFLHYQPKTLVLNNLEFDHADIFPDLDQIKNQFHLLIRTVPSNGLIIFPRSDENLSEVISLGCWSPTLQLGNDDFSGRSLDQGRKIAISLQNRDPIEFSWKLIGQHNLQNALSAIAAARHVGVPVEISCEALSSFQGVKRRMEIVFESDRAILYEDFAHHPTAIQSTLAGLRKVAPNDFVLAIIEPASHTMRNGYHKDQLLQSSELSDHVIWFQPKTIGWDMSILKTERSDVESEIHLLIKKVLGFSDTKRNKLRIIVMSNSGFSGLIQKLVNEFKKL